MPNNPGSSKQSDKPVVTQAVDYDPEFVEAWAAQEDAGYIYSEANIAKVYFGWQLARARFEQETLSSEREAVGELVEALARLKPPLRVEAFNSVVAGKPDFTAMLVRDDEPGCSSIIAQQMQDQTAADICLIVEYARATLAGEG